MVLNHPEHVETCFGEHHGRCVNDRCDCNPWFYGEFCEYKKCPDGCNGRGSCLHLTHDDSECLCHPCYDGTNCSWPLPRVNAWHHVKPKDDPIAQRPLAPANRTRCGGTSICGDLLVVGGEADDDTVAAAEFPNGGQRGVTNDVWLFDFHAEWQWRPLRLTCELEMPARQAHTVVHAHARTAWVFGGLDAKSNLRNDLWAIDVESRTCAPLHTSCPECARPQPRAFHSAASDARGTMWLFGGQAHSSELGGMSYLSDLWRVRCRPAKDGSCASAWGAQDSGALAGTRRDGRLQYAAPEDYGGGLLWLNLDNFRLDAEAREAGEPPPERPSMRASAALQFYTDGGGGGGGRGGDGGGGAGGGGGATRRLFLFGGFDGTEYLNDLWEWLLPSEDDDDEYYRAGGGPRHGSLRSFFPHRDAIGLWRRLLPPGHRPSARDGFLGLAGPGNGGLFYVILGRASDLHPQPDAATVWGYDPREARWKVVPTRNQGDNLVAREQSCGGIGPGWGGARLFSFGGDAELGAFDAVTGGHSWANDELWMFDGSCVDPVVSRKHPRQQIGECPVDANQYPPCKYGVDAPGSTPCLGMLYPVNDYTSDLPRREEPHEINFDPVAEMGDTPHSDVGAADGHWTGTPPGGGGAMAGGAAGASSSSSSSSSLEWSRRVASLASRRLLEADAIVGASAKDGDRGGARRDARLPALDSSRRRRHRLASPRPPAGGVLSGGGEGLMQGHGRPGDESPHDDAALDASRTTSTGGVEHPIAIAEHGVLGGGLLDEAQEEPRHTWRSSGRMFGDTRG